MTEPALHFTFDGRPLRAAAGASIASALLANGVRSWRRTRVLNAPRGLLCGIGTCFDCLVDVNDQVAVRACVTALEAGDAVRTSPSWGAGFTSRSEPEVSGGGPRRTRRGDVLVVGSGPAGLAATEAALGCGVSVVLVDGSARLGGQLLRQPAVDRRSGEPGARDGADRERVPPLGALGPGLAGRYPSIATASRLTIATGAAIWQLRAEGGGFAAWLEDGSRIEVRAVVLAPGASELVAPFPGWDLPGVVSAGAAQALLKAHDQLVGRRVLVAGSGPFLLPVAASLASGGARVLAVVEALGVRELAPMVPALARHRVKAMEAAAYVATLVRSRVPVRSGYLVSRCEAGPGGAVARAVVVRSGDRSSGDQGARRYDVDAVCTSFGFVPRLELARQLGVAELTRPGQPFAAVACDAAQATSVEGVFAAGEVTGIAGGEVAALEGEVAGAAAAAHCLGHNDPDRDGGARRLPATAVPGRRLARARAFADRVSAVYRLAVPLGSGLLSAETVVCRCEDVRGQEIQDALDAGATSAREVRNATRCGMGYCQGRTCGPLVQLAVAAAAGIPPSHVDDLQKRPVAVPVRLGLVAELPEQR